MLPFPNCSFLLGEMRCDMGSRVDVAAEKLESCYSEGEEETLSLCDLPVSMGDKQSRNEGQRLEANENFEFGSCGGSFSTEAEMCAADEVFYRGQLLPLRLSIGSDNGLPPIRQESRNPSRSESMDHTSSAGLTSASSRSSSINSHHSSSSSNSLATAHKPQKMQNRFHNHPSPKPQIWVPGTRPGIRTRNSTKWGLFRLGLVQTPKIELQDLKLRSIDKSFSSSSSTIHSSSGIKDSKRCSTNDSRKHSEEVALEKKNKQRSPHRRVGLIRGGCKCSTDIVDNIVIIKSVKMNERDVNVQQQQQHRGGRQAMAHRRTFEWLKELSTAGTPG